jgi:hypothetical protein
VTRFTLSVGEDLALVIVIVVAIAIGFNIDAVTASVMDCLDFG